ncbi:MAG: preprotein translocase subunit Sec61beta [Candidatus Aenigmatarchaeota archaeon]|nr:MAG: preprotein translocase subunit Sec61beta [Candidatus Aenigmarchaeota archaeon]
MSKKDKIQMPQSTAGLIRYFETEKEAIHLKPEHIVIFCALVIVVELLLRFRVFG